MPNNEIAFINEQVIGDLLNTGDQPDAVRVRDILAKAREIKGLDAAEMVPLMAVTAPDLLAEIYATAREVKERIYGRRLVIFAPLYISNLCANECTYCAFRARNAELKRRSLTQEEIAQEVRHLIEQGHKRVLMVAGESYPHRGFQYVLDSIATIYATREGRGEIRRVNVNVAPLALEEFRLLKGAGIGTYQLFQETYHRETYGNVHLGGKKRDYGWRVTCMDRAMEAGIDDVGIGVLFGLADWRFEILALMQHIRHLEEAFGVGPHTLSVPRLEPAVGSDVASQPPHAVSDDDFKKIVAILRLAVPYTGIIMSTRETAKIRRETFALGVSQISAGSRTNPGGYGEEEDLQGAQFSLGDHRPLHEVVQDVADLGYLPSFCTACYRLGRTGHDFMEFAKPGNIKNRCDPNAISTFQEYLEDFGSPKARESGERTIDRILEEMSDGQRKASQEMRERVHRGKRDVFI
jgi:2-iminoacetate synthase